MGLIAIIKVVTRAEMPGKPWLIQPGNLEWVTTIKCVNTRGWSIPSTIIFKGKVHIKGWFDEGVIPGSCRMIGQNICIYSARLMRHIFKISLTEKKLEFVIIFGLGLEIRFRTEEVVGNFVSGHGYVMGISPAST